MGRQQHALGRPSSAQTTAQNVVASKYICSVAPSTVIDSNRIHHPSPRSSTEAQV
jgi:hypothetical protein